MKGYEGNEMNIRKELDESCPNISSWAKTAAIIITTGLAGASSENNEMRINETCYESFIKTCDHEEAAVALRKLSVYSAMIQSSILLKKLMDN